MALVSSVENIVSIILIIVLGYVLQNKGWFHDSFGDNIFRLIMNIALPAAIFVSVLKYLTLKMLISLSGGLVYTFLSVILGYIMAWLMVKGLQVRPGRQGIFMNTVVNANTIFIGLPLNLLLFGKESLPFFLVYYITNTVSTWTLGVLLIQGDDPTLTGEEKGHGFDWKKLLPPPLLGFLVALVFLVFSIPVPAFINNTLDYVGEIVTPMSLIYIGIVLSKAGLGSINFDKDTIFALIGRFVLSPLVMIGLIVFGADLIGPLSPLESKTFIVQAAAPALAVMPILANVSHGDVKYATNVVTTSTLLFVIVIPIILMLLPEL